MMTSLMGVIQEYKRFVILMLMVVLGVTIGATTAYVTAANDIQISEKIMTFTFIGLALLLGVSLSWKKAWLAISWSVPTMAYIGIVCGYGTREGLIDSTNVFFALLMMFASLITFLLLKIYPPKRVALMFVEATLLTMFVMAFLIGMINGKSVVQATMDWLFLSVLFMMWIGDPVIKWKQDENNILYRSIVDAAFLCMSTFMVINGGIGVNVIRF